jgi:hypothetical protein
MKSAFRSKRKFLARSAFVGYDKRSAGVPFLYVHCPARLTVPYSGDGWIATLKCQSSSFFQNSCVMTKPDRS